MIALVKMHLQRAQQRMKLQVDKKRTPRTFEVGDLVFLKLQPYVQTSVATRQNYKLAFRYFGPYKIIGKINEVAYELLLPSSSAIHPIFHVSQLKPALGVHTQVSTEIPDPDNNLRYPVAVVDRRLCQRAGKVIPQLLVRWSGWPPSMATWEDEHDAKQRFPAAPAWGERCQQT
jgi:hypothetical protein